MAAGGTHEHTVNVALGEVLEEMRGGWEVDAEEKGLLEGGGIPDILVRDASGWPVVIEAELSNHTSAEGDATARLGRTLADTDRAIESAIALVYPEELQRLSGEALREEIRETDGLEYALYTRVRDDERGEERLPERGWLRGSVIELAMLVHRAATPTPRVDELANALEGGVEQAAALFPYPHGGERGQALADVLGQSDDEDGQTRRMAMTVIVNALTFQEALAEAGFGIRGAEGERAVRSIETFWEGSTFRREEMVAEWNAILERNYWPIFASAKAMLDATIMPGETASKVVYRLRKTAERLVQGGVTRSHDLTGTVFQRLIADRKFLATYYTRPEAAALLAGLALPLERPPGGADWSDGETLASVQIGDFACGTGTLLSAAYSRLSLLHELHGGDPRALHGPMMKNGLVGLDVLQVAVHLTAAMLAGAHPDTPFDGECLLTMPCGAQEDGSVAIGSLELLPAEVQSSLVGQAAAQTAGGRRPEDVSDLVTRVGHGKFDLVIMNPPFTRATNHEGSHRDVLSPIYAAFNTPPEIQEAMGKRDKLLAANSPAHGNAGMASYFSVLGMRKIRNDGALAMVLPSSALSGSSWNEVREQLRENYDNIVVVTIAGAGDNDSSFSADTGMAECLLVATKLDNDDRTIGRSDDRTIGRSDDRTIGRSRQSGGSSRSSRSSLRPQFAANSSPPPSRKRSNSGMSGASTMGRSAERRSCSARRPAGSCSTAHFPLKGRGR